MILEEMMSLMILMKVLSRLVDRRIIGEASTIKEHLINVTHSLNNKMNLMHPMIRLIREESRIEAIIEELKYYRLVIKMRTEMNHPNLIRGLSTVETVH
jgi:hypothetical protein